MANTEILAAPYGGPVKGGPTPKPAGPSCGPAPHLPSGSLPPMGESLIQRPWSSLVLALRAAQLRESL
jgi:hypothetical protein